MKLSTRYSFFSGATLAMAFSLLSVIVLLIWWQNLLSKNLEIQYRFFKAQVLAGDISDDLRGYIRDQDKKLANEIFVEKSPVKNAAWLIEKRLENRRKMLLYEQIFFILLLTSGHAFFLYIYFRERTRRKRTEETILLATHELRQPLQSLTLALESVAVKSRGIYRTAIDAGLRDIEKLSSHIRWLSKAFLAETIVPEITQIADLNGYFAELVASEFKAEDRNRIQMKLDAVRSIRIALNIELFRFCIRNLIENALRYGVGDVEVSSKAGTKRLIIEIQNDLAREDIPFMKNLGRAFYRSPSPAVQNKGGFGIGLYLANRILGRAKATLSIEEVNERLIATISVPFA